MVDYKNYDLTKVDDLVSYAEDHGFFPVKTELGLVGSAEGDKTQELLGIALADIPAGIDPSTVIAAIVGILDAIGTENIIAFLTAIGVPSYLIAIARIIISMIGDEDTDGDDDADDEGDDPVIRDPERID